MKSFISREQIEIRIKTLASEITQTIQEPFKVVGLLKGAFIFVADLVRNLPNVKVDFFTVSSYERTESTGYLKYHTVIPKVKDETILLVDDIADTGLTLDKIVKLFYDAGAKKVYTCALLDKPSRRAVDFVVDFRGFEIDNLFVIGYGMDFDEQYRNLPEIFIHEI